MRPPSLLRALLGWAARRLDAPDLLADADDLFAEMASISGRRAARRWYRRQVRAAIAGMLVQTRGRPGHRHRRVINAAGLGLDVKLGLRMLRRHPGLTLVSGTAMAFAILVGAGLFEFIRQTLPGPDLPLPSGEQVVGLRYWDRAANEQRLPDPAELERWSREVRSIDLLGGFRTTARNLFGDTGAGSPVEAALMSPAGFRLAGAPPLVGRVLVEADALPDARPVVVLGHRVWRERFGADTSVVGRTVRVDEVEATVVGVMPEGFGFPVRHDIWMPLEAGPAANAGGVQAFGRLVPGATIASAEAELAAFVERARRDAPERYGSLAAQVLPYRESLFGRPVSLLLRALILQLNLYATLFLLLVSANLALLFFARAAAREREIVLRTALGAGRSRIVGQLFVEALILCAGATALGLAATGPGLSWVEAQIVRMGGGRPPFWFQPSPSLPTMVYAGVLALAAAVVAGALPAWKATGQAGQARLNQASAGGGGMRFGGIWTAVVIIQIAATVVATAGAALMVRQARRSGTVDTTFPAGQYLTMEVAMDGAAGEPDLFAARVRAFEQRLAGTAGVAGVTLADRLPLMLHPVRLVETDAVAGMGDRGEAQGHPVSVAAVGERFFEVFGVPFVAGEGIGPRLPEDAVVVDRFFVESVLQGRPAVGRRIRFVDGAEPGGWHRVVGVVESLETDRPGALHLDEPPRPFVYRALRRSFGPAGAVRIAVHVPSGPERLAPVAHEVAAAVSPSLRLRDVQTLDRIASGEVAFWRFWADAIGLVSTVALVLSLCGIFAVTSFTVSRRTREIGVRLALGGPAPRVVAGILRRPLAQVGTGIAIGWVLVAVLVQAATGGLTLSDGLHLAALAALLGGVCGLACVQPALRALRVQPVTALSTGE